MKTSLNSMRFFVLASVLSMLVFAVMAVPNIAITVAFSQDIQSSEPSPVVKPNRRVYVPVEDLDLLLLEKQSNRVLLTADEYEKLLADAKQKAILRAPEDSSILSARYVGEIQEGVAFIQGELSVVALNEGLVGIPLDLSSVAIRSATLDGEPASLIRGEKGRVLLLIDSKQDPTDEAQTSQPKTLRLEMMTPVTTTAARQSMSIRLPSNTATQLKMAVPGNVEVKSGAAVVSRAYDESENQTVFELLLGDKTMNVVMSLNNKQLKDEQVVVARSVSIHELSRNDQLLHTTCSVDVINGAIERFAFLVPDGYVIESVNTDMLAQWSVESIENGENGNSDRLNIDLREATREDFVVTIKASRNRPTVGKWKATPLMPVDVAGQVTVVGVIADTTLVASNLETESLIPIDHEFLLAAIPQTFEDSSSDTYRIVSAYYSPQAEYQLNIDFAIPDPELILQSNTRLLVTDESLKLEGGLSATSRYEIRVDLPLVLPEGWRMTKVTNDAGAALEFVEDSSQPQRVVVRLPKRLDLEPRKIFFEAERIPENWLDPWQTNRIAFSGIQVEGQTAHTGSIAIATTEDVTLSPLTQEGLDILEDAGKTKYQSDDIRGLLAYDFEKPAYQLEVSLTRINPIVLARVYNFFSVLPQRITNRHEIILDIKRAGEDSFTFDLPLTTPKSISITSVEDALKDSSSVDLDNARRWTVQLADKTKGIVHLIVSYDQTQAENNGNDADTLRTRNRALSPLTVNDVELQNSYVVVEGSNELDTEIVNPGRVIDPGELSETQYQTSRQLIGTFVWKDVSENVSIKTTRRDFYPLPGTIVQNAELVSVVAIDGKLQTAATYSLVTKQLPFLEIELPKKSTLWSVQLDGQPAKPQRQGERLLVSLVGGVSKSVRTLQLVYETPVSTIGLSGELQTEAPILRVNRSSTNSADWEDVPMVDSKWRLIVPNGFVVANINGPTENRPTVWTSLSRWLVRIGGGMESRYATRSRAGSPAAEPNHLLIEESNIDLGGGMEFELLEKEDSIPSYGAEVSRGEVSPPPPKPTTNRPQFATPQEQAYRFNIKGLRSLNIQLDDSTEATELTRFDGTTLKAKLVNQSRIAWLAAAVAAFALAMTVLLTRSSVRIKFVWIAILLVVAQTLSLLTASQPIFDSLIEVLVLVAVASTIYFLVAGPVLRILGLLWNGLVRFSPSVTATAIALVASSLVLTQTNESSASMPPQERPIVEDADGLQRLLELLKPGGEIKIPDDTILIPFDLSDPKGRQNADKVLIPYQHFLDLKNVETQQGLKGQPPADYAIAQTSYRLRLASGEDDLIEGNLIVDVLTDDAVAIPLFINGGAFASATVDGEPAKLQFVDQRERNRRSKGIPSEVPSSILHLKGKGKRTFAFQLRIQPKQEGGWRLIQCKLPVGRTRGIEFQTPDEPIEVRISADADNRVIESTESQTINSVLNENGSLNVRWKPSAATQVVDQALTVQSDAVFDIREDGLRLNWHLQFQFRGAERSTFSVELPEGFLVEQVTGDNIRSWSVGERQENQNALLDVELLAASKSEEAFTVELSRRDFALKTETQSIAAPYLSVPSASLHKGTISIRRSPIVELKTGVARSANRVDARSVKRMLNMDQIDAKKSPLGIDSFQDFEFLTTPFAIELTANLAPEQFDSKTEALLRIGQSRFDVEARINVQVKNRLLYQVEFSVPSDLAIASLNAGSGETWTERLDGERKWITVLFPNGLGQTFSIVVAGTLDSFTNVPEDFTQTLDWKLPVFDVLGATSQSIEYAVQTDPAINVASRDLVGLEPATIRQFESWLLEAQRPLTRLALKSIRRFVPTDTQGTVRLNRVRPVIEVESVTNIRTTLLAVEETILLDFDIRNAGIRQIQFELPSKYRDARINATLISETVIDDQPDRGNVLVTLKLQDDVIGNYRVVVEQDTALPGADQSVPIPSILTGIVKRQFITLQNAGRDEIEVTSQTGMQRLNRQLQDYTSLKNKLAGAELTLAYASEKSAANTDFRFQLKTREVLDTVAAGIGFSKTTMVVDFDGTYRSQQLFQVNNRSEQYLDVEFPENATLLSVVVDGTPVKPVRWPQANNNRIRIPLLKTATGDLDYPVVVKYGGKLPELRSFSEVSFPVLKTLNINVQMSQFHLRLPETYRWLKFAGTMTQVNEAGELEEDFLSYQGRQIQKLAEQLEASASESGKFQFFSKKRAYQNLEKLSADLDAYSDDSVQGDSSKQTNDKLRELVTGNNNKIQSYQLQLEKEIQKDVTSMVDNRGNFNELIVSQDAKIARNRINKVDSNFANGLQQQNYQVNVPERASSGKKNESSFDREWFGNNKFNQSNSRFGNEGGGRQKLVRGQTISEDQPAQTVDEAGESNQELTFRSSNSILPPYPMFQQGGVGQEGLVGGDPGLGERVRGGQQGGDTGIVVQERNARSPELKPFSDSTVLAVDPDVVRPLSGNFAAEELSETISGENDGQRVGLTSLDVEMPSRGVDFYFRSPRGNVTVTAVPIEERQFLSWISIGVLAIAILVGWFLVSVFARMQSSTIRAGLALAMILFGVLSISIGLLPVFGVVAILGAIGLLVGSQQTDMD